MIHKADMIPLHLRPGLNLSAGLGVLAAALAHVPASAAQEPGRRSGAERQVVVQLAYALGEAHALHRLCAGAADATWYGRMQRLEAEEGGDDTGRRQLVEAFNAG